MIEMGKKYRTRDGRDVRIYAVDGYGYYPVHGAYLGNDGWVDCTWTLDGRYDHFDKNEKALDLIEVPHEVTVRQYFRKNSGTVGFAEHELNPMWETIGAIDITHNGKEIIDVKVVK